MLIGGKLSLRAIFGYDDDRDRAVDLCLRVSNPDLDVSVRGRYGAGRFAQPSKPRCYPHPAVSRLCCCDAEDIPDQIPGGRAAPAMDRRTPSPALTEGVVAVDQELLPAADEVNQKLGAGRRVLPLRARRS